MKAKHSGRHSSDAPAACISGPAKARRSGLSAQRRTRDPARAKTGDTPETSQEGTRPDPIRRVRRAACGTRTARACHAGSSSNTTQRQRFFRRAESCHRAAWRRRAALLARRAPKLPPPRTLASFASRVHVARLCSTSLVDVICLRSSCGAGTEGGGATRCQTLSASRGWQRRRHQTPWRREAARRTACWGRVRPARGPRQPYRLAMRLAGALAPALQSDATHPTATLTFPGLAAREAATELMAAGARRRAREAAVEGRAARARSSEQRVASARSMRPRVRGVALSDLFVANRAPSLAVL